MLCTHKHACSFLIDISLSALRNTFLDSKFLSNIEIHTLDLNDSLAVKALVVKPDELSSNHRNHEAKRKMPPQDLSFDHSTRVVTTHMPIQIHIHTKYINVIFKGLYALVI